MDLLKKDLSELVVKYQSLKLSKLEEMYKFYSEELSNLFEKHAPNKRVKITIRDKPEWYGQEHLELKRLARKYKKLYRNVDKKEPALCNILREINRNILRAYKSRLNSSKFKYINDKVRNCGKDSKKLFNLVSSLTGKIKCNIIPEKSDDLPNKFMDSFLNNINKIWTNLDTHPLYDPPQRDLQCELDTYIEMTQEEVHSIVMKANTMYCHSNPFPTINQERDKHQTFQL